MRAKPILHAILSAGFATAIGATCTTPADPGPPTGPPCPHLQIKAPDLVVTGTQARVSVSLIGTATPTSYHWTVTDGSIKSGQGTPVVLIDTAGSGSYIRATVELGGLPAECMTTAASASFLVGPPVTTSSR